MCFPIRVCSALFLPGEDLALSWARDSCGECLGTAGEAASSAREASGVSGQGPGVGAGTALSRHGGRTGGWVPTGRVAGAGTGFRARFSRGFCFVLEGRGRPWPRRAARRRRPGQRPGGVATPGAERLRSGGRTHREGHPSGPTACPSVPRRPLPRPFRGPGWGAASDHPETGVRRPAPEAVGGGRLLGCGAEDGGASLGARSHLTCDR